jgi:hypothetical protein
MTSSATHSWPIPVIPLGNVSAGVVAWRRGGRLHISPIVKATFAFAPGAVMTPAAPNPLRVSEQLRDETPDSSIRASLDTAPQLQHADVIFAGHAYAPSGIEAQRVAVRLLVRSSKGLLLVDKRLEVLGDRMLIPGRPPPDPTPFKRVPLTYERTYGGPDHGANPVGLGQLAELGGRRRLPNVVHPARSPHPAVEPAGFGPISVHWPARRRMLRATPRQVLDRAIVEIPDDLDLAYFQAAPADQQITFLQGATPPEKQMKFLQGDEWVVLEGLHPVHATLETQLPGARGVARVYLPGGSSLPVALVADTLFIDGDTERCSLIWRGSFPLPSAADLPGTGVVVAVELPGQTVAWPDRMPALPAPRPADPVIELRDEAPAPAATGRQRTFVISPEALARAGVSPAAPTALAAPPPPAPTFSVPPLPGPGLPKKPTIPPPRPYVPAPPAAAPAGTTMMKAAHEDDDESWGLGTMVMAEPEPEQLPRRGREKTTVMEIGTAPMAPAPRSAPPPAPPAPPGYGPSAGQPKTTYLGVGDLPPLPPAPPPLPAPLPPPAAPMRPLVPPTFPKRNG